MTNAEKFKEVFGVYATETWAMSESDFLLWLNGEYNGVERKTGKWIDVSDKLDREIGKRHDFVCPNCQRYARDFIAGVGDWWCHDSPEYCPHCGAKMEVEE